MSVTEIAGVDKGHRFAELCKIAESLTPKELSAAIKYLLEISKQETVIGLLEDWNEQIREIAVQSIKDNEKRQIQLTAEQKAIAHQAQRMMDTLNDRARSQLAQQVKCGEPTHHMPKFPTAIAAG